MRTLRHAALAIAWVSALFGLVFVILYVQPELHATVRWVAMAAAFIPYALALWLLASLGFALGARGQAKLLAVLALVGLIVQVGWARPYWPGPGSPGASGTRLSVLATNVKFGRAEPVSTADVISESDADVVIVLEATESFMAAPAITAVLADRPFTVGRAAPSGADASGTVIRSRYPLTEIARLDSGFDQYLVRVDAGPEPLTLLAAHPANMIGSAHTWEREGTIVADAVRPYLAEPLALVGDFNATPEHLTFRRLLDLGLTLGAQEAGVGWQPTYTALEVGPPLIAIDHVLTSERVTTATFRTFPVEGSDHEAIAADLTYR